MAELPKQFEDGVLLGKGGFGTVWQARSPEGALVAVKTPNNSSPDTLRRFARELSVQARLNHPHITKLIDFSPESEPPWCTMPLATKNLDDFARDLSTSPGSLLVALKQVISGVIYAHDEHVLHRDLKPSNVLVYIDDEYFTCTIADFGLSRLFTRDAMTYQTTTGQAFVSEWYSAPEQITQFSDVTVAADIFSLGRVIEFCLLIREDFATEFPTLVACAQVATRANVEERFPSASHLLEAVQLAGIPRAALASPLDQMRVAAARAAEDRSDTRLSELAFVLERAVSIPSQLLAMFATLPYALSDQLEESFPGRWRALLRAYVSCFLDEMQVNAAVSARDFLDHCMNYQSDPHSRALALFGLLRLGASYQMAEFEEVALGWLYARLTPNESAILAGELAQSDTTSAWVLAASDHDRLPIAIRELFVNV